jgi:hypothetical protein
MRNRMRGGMRGGAWNADETAANLPSMNNQQILEKYFTNGAELVINLDQEPKFKPDTEKGIGGVKTLKEEFIENQVAIVTHMLQNPNKIKTASGTKDAALKVELSAAFGAARALSATAPKTSGTGSSSGTKEFGIITKMKVDIDSLIGEADLPVYVGGDADDDANDKIATDILPILKGNPAVTDKTSFRQYLIQTISAIAAIKSANLQFKAGATALRSQLNSLKYN